MKKKSAHLVLLYIYGMEASSQPYLSNTHTYTHKVIDMSTQRLWPGSCQMRFPRTKLLVSVHVNSVEEIVSLHQAGIKKGFCFMNVSKFKHDMGDSCGRGMYRWSKTSRVLSGLNVVFFKKNGRVIIFFLPKLFYQTFTWFSKQSFSLYVQIGQRMLLDLNSFSKDLDVSLFLFLLPQFPHKISTNFFTRLSKKLFQFVDRLIKVWKNTLCPLHFFKRHGCAIVSSVVFSRKLYFVYGLLKHFKNALKSQQFFLKIGCVTDSFSPKLLYRTFTDSY